MKNKIILLVFLLSIIFIPRVHALECEFGSFKVTYNANGGTNASSPTCVTNTLSSIKPTRSGYKFLGWSTSRDSKTVVFSPGQSVFLIEDITLYAVWAKGYKVTYNANGGTVSKKSKLAYYGLEYGTLTTPSRKGYKFLGWFTSKTDGSLIESDSKVTKKKDHTLYAHWEKIKYKITYELNGGVQNTRNRSKYYVTTSTFRLYEPTKKGYKFAGWYKDSSFSKKETYIYRGTTGNKTFYAKWTPIKYSVKFNGNGYTSGSTKTQTGIKYNKTYNLNKNGYNKKYYVFDSWNTKKDGTGTKYLNEQSIKNLTSKNGKVINVYARWKKRKYTITYELNGGINPDDQYTEFTISSDFTLKDPTREGYVFEGWYNDSSFSKKITKIAKGTSGNKIFYAKWRFVAYTINYELNGGVNPSSAPKTYTQDVTTLLPKPTRSGYDFEGWYTESTFINKVTKIQPGETGNKTFYAKWEKQPTYSITYMLNGGVNPSNAPVEYTKEQEISLPTATRNGYAFEGWYKENTFENKVTKIEKGSTGNKTFYAKWNIINYSISYILNGGKNPNNIAKSYTIESSVSLPTPNRNGYTFEGWYTEESFINRVSVIPKGTIGNKKYYAKWKPIVYLIDYETNNGMLPNSAVLSYTIEDEITLPKPVRRGFAFLGWYTESTFENKVDKIPVGSTEDKTFYAKWQNAVTFSIEYTLNGGVNPSNAPSSYTTYEEVILPKPTKSNAGFDGWYTESTFVNKVTKIESGSTGNKHFYAKWGSVASYTITYKLNGGTNPSNAPTTYTNYDEVILPTPTKTGYTFEGWYKESAFTNRVTKIDAGSTGNKTFYAKWTQNTLIRNYNYKTYNNTYDNKLTSKADIKNTLYNIMNEGYSTYTLYCNYSSVAECFSDFTSVTGDADLMKSLSDYVNPFNSYKTFGTTRMSDGRIIVDINYTYSSSQKTAINGKIDAAISANNMGSLSNADKILKIHDYVVNRVVYTSSGSDIYNAYGALINGKSVCQGYADAVALFLDRFNIPNLKVSSDTHTWNLVYINNKWLHLDATWDDPITSNGNQILLHDYYLLTKAQLYNLDTSEHTFNTTLYPEGK